ncbi:MAG: type II toxin-antitoxin system HicA family toxin [Dehalococcoidia bacterium]|jgi:predicted RNA binding protein YcfA (HicA-like mRNA interferase family)|nr:type II toxin-antitoxin system HicA family toxin [Dehalococcoidia bacterium]
MKRRDLIKLLLDNGWWKARDCGDHTVYTNGKALEPIARHSEINEILARKIIKRRGLK